MQTATRFIAYYRVSTKRQGQSGLGLEAQQAAVEQYLGSFSSNLIKSFTETESGRNDDRPQLQAALEACRIHQAKLVIAKLDRLARSASFLLNLRDAGVDFVCCDMPDANRLTVGILAMVAEDEAERISQRTKAALQAAKARGKRLGTAGPKNLKNRALGSLRGNQVKSSQADQRAMDLAPMIRSMAEEGLSLRKMAEQLNAMQVPTARGGKWAPVQVKRLRDRIDRL
ncbi:recombinase family protein [Wenzhouxiangella sp. EGI_FJ10409]|uniref:recombinase family protein n=1 Tax=Wenzhouxiangella sp. EGI_FJ10409 TaxID=3243767 RepID=UPI0035E07B1F